MERPTSKPSHEGENTLQKDLDYYLSLNYPISVEETEKDGRKYFILSIPDLPGCWAEGATFDEARNQLEESKEVWIMANLGEGRSIPEPVIEEEFSGKFLLRITPKVHMKLSKSAEREGQSLNQFVRSILEGNMNINSQLIENMRIILSHFSLLEKGFDILSQRLESLESCYNKLSECVRSTYLWGDTNYSLELGQTDVIEVSSFYQIMQPGQSTLVAYSFPKSRSTFPLKKASEVA